jgi:hypothetical protein
MLMLVPEFWTMMPSSRTAIDLRCLRRGAIGELFGQLRTQIVRGAVARPGRAGNRFPLSSPLCARDGTKQNNDSIEK